MGESWAECCSVVIIAAAAVSLTAGSESEMIRHSQTESVELSDLPVVSGTTSRVATRPGK